MANKQFTDLTATTSLNDADVFALVNSGGNSRKITAANLRTSMQQGLTQYLVPKLSGWTQVDATSGATFAEGSNNGTNSTGIKITVPANTASTPKIAMIYRTAPSTPYRVMARLTSNMKQNAVNTFQQPMIGWYDGTKLQMIGWEPSQTASAFTQVWVFNFTNTTTFSASATTFSIDQRVYPRFFYIEDDGTNVTFGFSEDSVTVRPLYTVAKASGYLGSTGYANIAFAMDGHGSNNSEASSAILSLWDENALNRGIDNVTW